MAESQNTLSDFFNKKNKKKIKGSNLNNQTTEKKTEVKKVGKKDAEEDGWEEEQVVETVMKVEVAGKLTREEEKKDEDDSSAPCWGTIKSKADSTLNEKRYPTLAKSILQSSNINIDDGADAKINIQTSKNAFSALEGGQDSDDEGKKRPKEIKPAMIQKKKGESEKQALQREVDKYKVKKPASGKAGRDEESDSEEEESDADEVPAPAPVPEKKKKKTEPKKDGKKDEAAVEQDEEPEVVIEEDVKIQPDLGASKAKYDGRKKLPRKDLPRSELEANKENAYGKKKKVFMEEEDEKSKRLQFIED